MMKKLISAILALTMALSLCVSAFAAPVGLPNPKSQIPVIRISGDGTTLSDADGNKIFRISEIGDFLLGSSSEGDIKESVLNVVKPFLIQGVLTGNYDPYYEALEREIGEIFEPIRLDDNGEVSNGTRIEDWAIAQRDYDMTHDEKGSKGYYARNDYYYRYDWRLDPITIADEFRDYIEAVKTVTKSDEVVIIASCLGANICLAYFDKYGTDGIRGFAMTGATVNGAEILSEMISGRFDINGHALLRLLDDLGADNRLELDEFVLATVDLLVKSGAVDATYDVIKNTIYEKVAEGVTSALALSTFYTFPGYWAAVASDDYENALCYVFGEPDSEKRVKYAGLIEKIENYHEKIGSRVAQIITDAMDDGVNFGIVSKYGYQIAPLLESCDEIGDQFVSVKRSSFGATTSKIYSTLSDEYIAERVALGYGDYISPDKQIDASTGLFADYTWFTKGISHSDWTSAEVDLLITVTTADRQLTVDELGYGRFWVKNPETGDIEIMTEENCNIYNFDETEQDMPDEQGRPRLFEFLASLIRWFTALINIIAEKFA